MTEKQRKAEQLAANPDEALLGRRILDLDSICSKRYSPVSTQFLTPEEQAYCEMLFHLLESRCIFEGGYEGAERSVAILFPEENYSDEEYSPVCAIRIKNTEGLTHRDVLGGVLSLGIKRDTLGDIVIGEKESYLFITTDMADYVALNLTRIGRNKVSAQRCPTSEVIHPEIRTEEIKSTVASLRLDSVLAEGFRLSRETAKQAISRQLVQINHRTVESASHSVNVSDVITLRGKGKIVLDEVSGESRKGRIWVKILKYV